MRNPFLAYPMSQGWHDGHEAIDYATPIGFEFTAPTSGTYVHRADQLARVPGAAGVFGDLCLDDGRRIRFCHLHHHIATDGQRVTEGVTLAATGNTGYVDPAPTRADPSAGAHMHTTGFDADGNRWNWTLEATTQEDTMNETQDFKLDAIFRALVRQTPNGPYFMTDAIANEVQNGGTSGGVTIDYDKLADALLRRALTK